MDVVANHAGDRVTAAVITITDSEKVCFFYVYFLGYIYRLGLVYEKINEYIQLKYINSF